MCNHEIFNLYINKHVSITTGFVYKNLNVPYFCRTKMICIIFFSEININVVCFGINYSTD